jgi:hypothetical protein
VDDWGIRSLQKWRNCYFCGSGGQDLPAAAG